MGADGDYGNAVAEDGIAESAIKKIKKCTRGVKRGKETRTARVLVHFPGVFWSKVSPPFFFIPEDHLRHFEVASGKKS